MMKKNLPLPLKILLCGAIILSFQAWGFKSKPKLLVFCKTAGFHHQSIPNGVTAIQKLGAKDGFTIDTTTDAAWFRDEVLKNYAAVIFLSTTGDLFDGEQEAAMERYIHAGGGFVGIHAATDAEYQWEWYGKMIGGYFESHPKIQQATIRVVDGSHISTKHLSKEWVRTDEWYNFKNLSKHVHVLLTIDEKTYSGGKNGNFHPMAWWHNFEGGRVFYTELGHTEESFLEPLYLQHLSGGIQYAIGKNTKLNY